LHELSITQNILSIALEKAEAEKAARISRVNLVIGDMTGVVDDCVEFYFDFLSKDTIAAQAELSFRHPPVRLHCRNCGADFSPGEIDWTCPACQKREIEVISGRELYVESIEVE